MVKVKVTYGGKTTKIMDLTEQQIKDRNKLNEKNKKPYIVVEDC